MHLNIKKLFFAFGPYCEGNVCLLSRAKRSMAQMQILHYITFSRRSYPERRTLKCINRTRDKLDKRLVWPVCRVWWAVGCKRGLIPWLPGYGSTNVLNLMRAITGSQWKSVSSRVVCVYLGTLNIRRAAAFWISCRNKYKINKMENKRQTMRRPDQGGRMQPKWKFLCSNSFILLSKLVFCLKQLFLIGIHKVLISII